MSDPTELEPAAWWDDLQSIPDLKRAVLEAENANPSGSANLRRALSNIKEQTTTTLLHRIATVEHPMVAWALHVELDTRDVPPCLRPWMLDRSRQVRYLATLADLRWLVVRNPEHVTKYERLRGVFRYEVGDDRWHKTAIWAYRQCRGRGHVLASRLGLTDAMRCHTLTMPNIRQSNDRRLLRQGLPSFREATIRHALERPDKSGLRTPGQIAERRALLVSTYVLLGRNQIATVDHLQRIWGVDISRQTLARQLQAAATTGDDSRMVFGVL